MAQTSFMFKNNYYGVGARYGAIQKGIPGCCVCVLGRGGGGGRGQRKLCARPGEGQVDETAPILPGAGALEVEWSSSSSDESPVYATKPVFILLTAGSEKRPGTGKRNGEETGEKHIPTPKTNADMQRGNQRVNSYVNCSNDGRGPFNSQVDGTSNRGAAKCQRMRRPPVAASRIPKRHMKEKRTQREKRKHKNRRSFH